MSISIVLPIIPAHVICSNFPGVARTAPRIWHTRLRGGPRPHGLGLQAPGLPTCGVFFVVSTNQIFMSICVYTYIDERQCVRVCVCVCAPVSLQIYVYIDMHLHTHVYAYTHIHIFIYIYMHISIHARVCLHRAFLAL